MRALDAASVEFGLAAFFFPQRILALREQIEKNADAAAIGRAAAPVYLGCISRILTYSGQLDVALGFELFASNVTFEENLPRANTGLRMMGELNTMLLGQLDGFLNCFGGTAAINAQHLEEWAKGDQCRLEVLLKCLDAAAARAKRSRR
jgi:hypothetical protein